MRCVLFLIIADADITSLASFVTTYMEEEAEKLMSEAFSKNFIDYEEVSYTLPRSLSILTR